MLEDKIEKDITNMHCDRPFNVLMMGKMLKGDS